MLDTMLKQARIVAKSYARRNGWADLRDLEQEATVAIIEAYPAYDASKGATPERFGTQIAWRALRMFIYKNKAPVSGNWRSGKELLRAECAAPVVLEGLGDENASAEDVLMREEAKEMTSQRIAELMASDDEATLAFAVLMGEKSAVVAARTHKQVRDVYRATYRVKEVVKSDAVLRAAWETL